MRCCALVPNLNESVYPVDDFADTVHLAAFDGDVVVGTATVFR